METEQQIAELQKQIEGLQKKVKRLENTRQDQLSMAVVSGDMDKILAVMIISLALRAWIRK